MSGMSHQATKANKNNIVLALAGLVSARYLKKTLFLCRRCEPSVCFSLCVCLKMLNTVSLSLLRCPEADTSICGRWWGKAKGVLQVAFVALLLTWRLLSSSRATFKGELSDVYNWKQTIYTKGIVHCIHYSSIDPSHTRTFYVSWIWIVS